MKYVDDFRSPDLATGVLREINVLMERIGTTAESPIRIMEVCGGHTHTISKFGLDSLLPPGVQFVHGPGCPVCVLPTGAIDTAIAVAEQPNIIFTTFGDVMRVPGSESSLAVAKARGADVRVVYAPSDALAIAQQNPQKRVVFFAIGFETTAPATALTVLQAEKENVANFSILCHHVLVIPPLRALLEDSKMCATAEGLSTHSINVQESLKMGRLHGFLAPGHVSMVIGTKPYEPLAQTYHKPFVVAGFEPVDILMSLVMVLRQIANGRAEVENQYNRVVRPDGNPAAMRAVLRVFTPTANREWRGIGNLPESGLALRPEYQQWDVFAHLTVPQREAADPKICQCGQVLRGEVEPWECKVFATACTPETPIGACMVSSEGACAAYYNYGRLAPNKRLPLAPTMGR
ncbi:MAG: hydrogenase formation protein HypD [Polyangiaceae bacterium]|nr:hydrogenase formation protein HypD [Polyangiaceae bacterium]